MENMQREFEESMMKLDNDFSYTYMVLPYCKKALELLGNDPFKWPVLANEFHLIDIYYETLYHYYTLHIDKPFPFKLLVLLMLYRPLIYYVVCLTKKYDELPKLNDRINNEIDEIFKKQSDNERVVNLKEIMNMKHISPDKLSSLAYMHYFIGFKFTKSLIGVNKDKVNDIAHEYNANIIYINVLHNLAFHDKEVYVYKDTLDKIGFKFLTSDIVKRFRPIDRTLVPKTYNFKDLFVHDKLTETNIFVLNYNDTDFTIITKDDKPYVFNQKQAERFMKGALPMLISNETFINYAEQTYNDLIPRIVYKDKVDIDIELPRFARIYNEYIRPVLDSFKIDNKLQLSRFCDRLNEVIEDIPKLEKDLFVFYCRLYNWSGTIDKHDFVEYMKSYFEPVDAV